MILQFIYCNNEIGKKKFFFLQYIPVIQCENIFRRGFKNYDSKMTAFSLIV